MKIIGVIPARFKSSRFPGKPLVDINGKPMIWWTYQQSRKVKEICEVYVATDDIKIYDICIALDIPVVMTSERHLTGTDRVAEVAEKIAADIYINIQGDEPLIEPETIKEVIAPLKNNDNISVVNLMTKINNPIDVINSTIPKVIVNENGRGLFLTRSAVPYPKGALDYAYYKQVCVYSFRPEALRFFADYGKNYGKARNEQIEDIEILRFIENDYFVQFVEVVTKSIAVDTPKDLEKVRMLISNK